MVLVSGSFLCLAADGCAQHAMCSGGRETIYVLEATSEDHQRSPTVSIHSHTGVVSSLHCDSAMQYLVSASGSRGYHLAPTDDTAVFYQITAAP